MPNSHFVIYEQYIIYGCFLKWWYPQNIPQINFQQENPWLLGTTFLGTLHTIQVSFPTTLVLNRSRSLLVGNFWLFSRSISKAELTPGVEQQIMDREGIIWVNDVPPTHELEKKHPNFWQLVWKGRSLLKGISRFVKDDDLARLMMLRDVFKPQTLNDNFLKVMINCKKFGFQVPGTRSGDDSKRRDTEIHFFVLKQRGSLVKASLAQLKGKWTMPTPSPYPSIFQVVPFLYQVLAMVGFWGS